MAKHRKLVVDGLDYRKLLTSLASATAKYRSSTDTSLQREGWSDAIVAVCNFLRVLPDADVGALQVIDELLGDLGDLSEGRQSLRLKSAEKTPKRRTRNVDIIDFATAAALVDYLVDGGMSEPDAARKVARQAKRIGAALPKGTTKGQQQDHERLLNWRARLRSEKLKDGDYAAADETYRMIREWCREHAVQDGLIDLRVIDFFLNELWPNLKGQPAKKVL